MLLALVGAAMATAACSGTGASGSDATKTATSFETATPEAPDLTIFHDFIYPVAGGCLPKSDVLMPNAPRDYRGGVHEGVDFYNIDNCTKIEKDTPAIAAKDGVVIRADHDYHPLTPAELEAADRKIAEGHANDFDVIDLFRGRQVWIDHGHGIVTRYAHLNAVPDNIVEGVHVVQGETVGLIGDSGTPESISNPDTEIHLHWELRAGDSFLGKGLPPDEVRAIYTALFEPVP
ncbi:MAG TPA: M23 family metallopeptidase [Dehalococcoidia bacterium]